MSSKANTVASANPPFFFDTLYILLFLNSTKAGLLKNIQKHLSRFFGSREIRKTKVGTFF